MTNSELKTKEEKYPGDGTVPPRHDDLLLGCISRRLCVSDFLRKNCSSGVSGYIVISE